MEPWMIIMLVAIAALVLYLVLKKPTPPPPKQTAIQNLTGLLTGVVTLGGLL